ncbi:hypothetical protein KDH_28320 [Dictyobacter sp. S3.2.2.5]|uniref:Uncharacterized protein n=1 Tax=Dictyobacter halimunensis TaxID=3026934 RepID=A0ABQ6FQY2_9CHLR|nr:hypothetical protein KDH_28320 [Dictyobacter sp. S3.2.2.5]
MQEHRGYERETSRVTAASLFRLEVIEQLCQGACLDLVTVMGAGVLMEQEQM